MNHSTGSDIGILDDEHRVHGAYLHILKGVYFLRGDDTVIMTLTNAAQMRLPEGTPTAERKKRVEEVLALFGLTPVKDELVDKLSGGQRKRLSICVEFISNPSLFVLDEPDSGLDGVMARDLMEQLRDLSQMQKKYGNQNIVI